MTLRPERPSIPDNSKREHMQQSRVTPVAQSKTRGDTGCISSEGA